MIVKSLDLENFRNYRTLHVTFDKDTLQAKLPYPIDTNFEVCWSWTDSPRPHWTSPKVEDAVNGIISIHKNDFERLGPTMKVYYVKALEEPQLYLG